MLFQQWCLSTTEKEQPLHALGLGFAPEGTRPENEKSAQVAPSYPRARNLHLASCCGRENPALKGASGDGRPREQGHEAGADAGKPCGSTSARSVPKTDRRFSLLKHSNPDREAGKASVMPIMSFITQRQNKSTQDKLSAFS